MNNLLNRLVGSKKQQVWASSIIRDLQDKYPDTKLPDIRSSEWWIQNRDKPISVIMSSIAAHEISTPFTSQFPRYRRSDAIEAIQTLGKDFVVLDLETTGLKRSEGD